MLRKIRIISAALIFILISGLFLDISGLLHKWLGVLAKIQFLPAILSLNFVVVAALMLATLVFGRLYCSVICPLGILQDIISWLRFKLKKKARHTWSKENKWLRYSFLTLFILAMIFGLQTFVALLDPYSAFGRIAENLFSPIYRLGNNFLSLILSRSESYAIYPKEVWLKSVPTFIIAGSSLIILIILAFRGGRTYCNTICPVGTALSFISRFSAFRPVIDKGPCKLCNKCAKNCKASCIDLKNFKIDHSRCVTCFNCIDSCRFGALHYKFAWRRKSSEKDGSGHKTEASHDISRRAFLKSSALLLTTTAIGSQAKKKEEALASVILNKTPKKRRPVSPPGSLSLKNFYSHCTACQLCVASCPNEVLRPSSNFQRLMQPEMSYERGYCKIDCVKCSEVCPAGAILPIKKEDKKKIHIGLASVEQDLCIVNSQGVKCGNCARHCPVGAIRMVKKTSDKDSLRIPSVIEKRCIGCGACEFACPAWPLKAIRIEGREVHIKS